MTVELERNQPLMFIILINNICTDYKREKPEKSKDLAVDLNLSPTLHQHLPPSLSPTRPSV